MSVTALAQSLAAAQIRAPRSAKAGDRARPATGARAFLPAARNAFLAGGAPLPQRIATARVAALRASPLILAAAAPSTVKIIIQGRNIEVTDAIRDYCESKLTKAIAHVEGNVKEVDVTLSVRGGDSGTGARQQRAEVTVFTLRHGVARAEEVAETLYASIDLVCDKVQRKLRKIKEKAVDNGTWPGRGGKPGDTRIIEVLSSTEVVDDLQLDRIPGLPKEVVRQKFLRLSPMSVDEATEQLEAVGHDFFMFLEKESGKVQVLYRRKSHGYGVLVPFDAAASERQ